jgi:tight adherence protein B
VSAMLLAFGAGACGVFAAWEAVGLAGAVAERAAAIVAPLRAGREPSASERRRLVLTGALGLLAGGWLMAGPVLGLVLAAGTPFGARQALAAVRARRRERLVDAAPAVARAISDALAGGHSIRGAVQAAHRGGVSGPARDELRAAAHALAMGEETEAVLERLRVAAAHPSYDALAAAILLQREAGGDLAGLLRRLAATLEENARAQADARSLTAQARFTALLVACLPAGAAVLVELAAPGTLAGLLRSPLTAWLMACSVILQAISWVAILRIARVER